MAQHPSTFISELAELLITGYPQDGIRVPPRTRKILNAVELVSRTLRKASAIRGTDSKREGDPNQLVFFLDHLDFESLGLSANEAALAGAALANSEIFASLLELTLPLDQGDHTADPEPRRRYQRYVP